MAAGTVTVLIATPLEAEHAARIAAADPRLSVIYEPGLLPEPRYAADHGGSPRPLSAADLERWARLRAQAEISFDFDWQAPADMPRNCPRLRWVQGTSAGLGGFLQRTGLDQTPLVFTTAAGVHGIPLAEFSLLGLLYFIKNGPGLRQAQAAHEWRPAETAMLSGSRVLLVGLGGIGRQVARTLAAAGAQVIGAGRAGRQYDLEGVSGYVSSTDLASVLPTVRGVVLACPLTDDTRHLIGERELALLPPGAVLVNVARGAVIDEQALAAALASGHLGGACLDVFEKEPLPADSPLWDLDNVLVSPHTASTIAAENGLIADLFIDNLQRWLAGSPLRNVYDRDAGY
jgi:phosphoglycerate dehydrogenase-like enzyme